MEKIPDQNPVSARIAEQNDAFRRKPDSKEILGQVLVTAAVAAKGAEFIQAAMTAVQTFDAFDEWSDPSGEHGFGAFNVNGIRLFWKIDLYDTEYHYGSEAPDDPTRTRRVLTIMFPSDY